MVRDLLREGGVAMSSVNLAEAIYVIGRRAPNAGDELRALIDPLVAGPLTIVSTTGRHAWTAGRLRLAHYRRRDRAVSLADCFCVAACGRGDRLATADPALLEIARLEGVGTVRLLDARGD